MERIILADPMIPCHIEGEGLLDSLIWVGRAGDVAHDDFLHLLGSNGDIRAVEGSEQVATEGLEMKWFADLQVFQTRIAFNEIDVRPFHATNSPAHHEMGKTCARLSIAIVRTNAVIEMNSEIQRVLPYDVHRHTDHGRFIEYVPEDGEKRDARPGYRRACPWVESSTPRFRPYAIW